MDRQHWEEALAQLFALNLPSLSSQSGYVEQWITSWREADWVINKNESVLAKVCYEEGKVQLHTVVHGARASRRTRLRASITSYTIRSLATLFQDLWFRADVTANQAGFYEVVSVAKTAEDTREDFIGIVPHESLAQCRCRQFRHSISWASQVTFGECTDKVIEQFFADLSSVRVNAVSDGSSKDRQGTAAWILQFSEEHIRFSLS